MMNWFNQRKISKLPTLDKWSDLGFVEVVTPEDFFNVGYVIGADELPKIKGILCPIPEKLIPDKKTLASYYNDVRGHAYFEEEDNVEGGSDKTSRLEFYTGPHRVLCDEKKLGPKNLAPELVAIEDLLKGAYKKAIGRDTVSIVYQLNSNFHRYPGQHGATGVATLDGLTTIMFAENANGKLVGKKSLPPNSIAIFLGMHAAPDTTGPRFNILCA